VKSVQMPAALEAWFRTVVAGQVPEIVLSEAEPTAIRREAAMSSARKWLKERGSQEDPHKALWGTLEQFGVVEGREGRQKGKPRKLTYVFPPAVRLRGGPASHEPHSHEAPKKPCGRHVGGGQR